VAVPGCSGSSSVAAASGASSSAASSSAKNFEKVILVFL
jgi:hypothetical protein